MPMRGLRNAPLGRAAGAGRFIPDAVSREAVAQLLGVSGGRG
jgi:hypothetical protein